MAMYPRVEQGFVLEFESLKYSKNCHLNRLVEVTPHHLSFGRIQEIHGIFLGVTRKMGQYENRDYCYYNYFVGAAKGGCTK